jgi:hypothetical protein
MFWLLYLLLNKFRFIFGGILLFILLAIDFSVFPFYVFGYLREEKRRKETVNKSRCSSVRELLSSSKSINNAIETNRIRKNLNQNR